LKLYGKVSQEKTQGGGMLGKRTRGFVVLAFLFLAVTGWGAQNIGKALDEALKSRESGSVAEVINRFQRAVEFTSNPMQKASVRFFLAEFLMEKREWKSAIGVYTKIMSEGADDDKARAYYGAAQAYMSLNQPNKAKALCAELKAKFPNNAMEGVANYMKKVAPNGIHARLGDFFAEFSAKKTSKPSQGSKPRKPRKMSTTNPAASQPVVKEGQEGHCQPIVTNGWRSKFSGNFDTKGLMLKLSSDMHTSVNNRFALNKDQKNAIARPNRLSPKRASDFNVADLSQFLDEPALSSLKFIQELGVFVCLALNFPRPINYFWELFKAESGLISLF